MIPRPLAGDQLLPKSGNKSWVSNPGKCKQLTGFSPVTIVTAAMAWKIDKNDLFLALVYLRSGCPFASLAYMSDAWSFDAPESEAGVRDAIYRAFNGCPQERAYKPEGRLKIYNVRFPGATAIVDGVPVRIRGNTDAFNPKYGSKAVVFQVVIDLQGRPLAWSKGLRGSRNDSFALNGWEPFPHFQNEHILADLAYVANAHCVTPWKGNEKDASVSKEDRTFYETVHRALRVRIEHFFARIHSFRFLLECNLEENNTSKAFNLLMHMMSRALEGQRVYNEPETREAREPFYFGDRCECGFYNYGKDTVRKNRETLKARKAWLEHNKTLGKRVAKQSRKCSKSTKRKYNQLSKDDQEAAFSAKKKLRRQRSDEETKRKTENGIVYRALMKTFSSGRLA